MKKSLLLAALLLSCAAQADDADCINASNLSAINLTSNSSFAEVSWKVDVTNSCSYPISMGYKWEAFDSEQFLLDSDSGFGEIIPPAQTVSIKDIALLSPPEKAEQLVSQLFTPSYIQRSDSTVYSCISVIENNKAIVEANSSFVQTGWSTIVENNCMTPVTANITNFVLEGNNHAINYDLSFTEYFPSQSRKAIFGTHLVDPELGDFIVETQSVFKSIEVAELPRKIEFGKRIWNTPALLDVETSFLFAVIDVQDETYYQGGFTLNPDLTFSFLPSTLAIMEEYSARPVVFSSSDGMLSIPSLDIQNYPAIDTLEHVELKLTNPKTLTFSLGSFSDAAYPNSTFSTVETGDCLRINDASLKELSRNSSYVEMSYKIEISNSCNQRFEFSSYIHFLTEYHVEIDYDLIFGAVIEPRETKSISDTTLLDPVGLSNTAKIYISLSP